MIEVRDLTKRYGPTVAVDALSFDVRPGSVTGFLGPNGSGKPNLGHWHLSFGAARHRARLRAATTGPIARSGRRVGHHEPFGVLDVERRVPIK
jgi:ABC-type branched-subunit amino acid transport system ATPase component